MNFNSSSYTYTCIQQVLRGFASFLINNRSKMKREQRDLLNVINLT